MVVRFGWGKRSEQELKTAGFHVEWKEYAGMGHSSSDGEIHDVSSFLQKRLP